MIPKMDMVWFTHRRWAKISYLSVQVDKTKPIWPTPGGLVSYEHVLGLVSHTSHVCSGVFLASVQVGISRLIIMAT